MRRALALAAALVTAAAIVVLAPLGTAPGSAQQGGGPPTIVSDLGVPVTTPFFLGAAGPGQVFAVSGQGQQAAFAARAANGAWSALGSAAGVDGTPLAAYRVLGAGFGGAAGPPAASVSAGGSFVALAQDRPDDGGPTVLLAHPAGSAGVRELPAPVAGDPADPAAPSLLADGEVLGNGPRLGAVAALDGDGGSSVLVAPQRSDGPGGIVAHVLRWDGGRWSEEPIDGAAGDGQLSPVAIAGPSLDGAWLLAQGPDGQGPLLFRRSTTGGAGPHWAPVDLGGSLLAPASPAGLTVSLGGANTQPLVATTQGAWVDVLVTPADGSPTLSATGFVDAGTGRVTGTWCNATAAGQPACDRPLGVAFGGGAFGSGYASAAFAGAGPFGIRVISDDGQGDELRFDGTAFATVIGTGQQTTVSAAFWSLDEGYLGSEPARRVTRTPDPPRLAPAEVAVRHPFLGAAPQPGAPVGATASAAIAVGVAGTIARYTPGAGWTPEFLRDPGTGARITTTLRAAAWPAPDYAIAVGDRGAVFSWTPSRGTWEPDEGRPDDLTQSLTGVAFQAGDGDRGYITGRSGVLLSYDKTFQQQALPDAVKGLDMLGVAFAGPQALVVARGPNDPVSNAPVSHLLVDDGHGTWSVDPQVDALLAAHPGANLTAVAGLPDGGAVVAGRGLVAYRDGPGAAWRADPLPPAGAGNNIALTPVAVAALRDGGTVRALLSLQTDRDNPYPTASVRDAPGSPDLPPPVRAPYAVPRQGELLRGTSTGWRDEQHAIFGQIGGNVPLVPDPILTLGLIGPDGTGWTLGGATTPGAVLGRGFGETAEIDRYPADPTTTTVPGGAQPSTVPLPAGPARFVVAGGAECGPGCAGHPNAGIAGEVLFHAAVAQDAALASRPNGPRALLYTGGRFPTGGIRATGSYLPRGANGDVPEIDQGELDRYAQLGQGVQGLPFFAAPSAGELLGGTLHGFAQAFAGAPAPFGQAAPAPGTTPVASAPVGGGARTHYAFDSHGAEGTVRVIVVDLSRASPADPSGAGAPAEDQTPWVASVLDDAKAQQIPAIVMGNAPLTPSSDVDATQNPQAIVGNAALQAFAGVLADHGASAYFFESEGQNRTVLVPAGASDAIPSWGTGSLNYGRPYTADKGVRHDDAGQLLAEVDVAHRDAQTNRAPVSVRLIPTISDLAIDPLDGTDVRRGQTALFAALARRPRAGNPTIGATENAADPYLPIPAGAGCPAATGCSTSVDPEYRFVSSDPDIADFVASDPNSSDPRSVRLGSDGKPVPSATSGLLCGFNPGTTTVRVETGGLSYAIPVTIGGGAPQRPCGTVPLPASRFPVAPAIIKIAASPTAPSAAPASSPPPHSGGTPPGHTPTSVPAPAPPAAPVQAAPAPAPHAPPPAPKPHPPAAHPARPVPVLATPPSRVVGIAPPNPPSAARPTPPSGTASVQVNAFANVPAAREQREEEAAPEDAQAFSRLDHGPHAPIVPLSLAMLLIAAAAGSAIRGGRGQSRPEPAPVSTHRRP